METPDQSGISGPLDAPDASDALGDPAASFTPRRARLMRIAYRMLGSVAEAEDVVQDAYLRWHGTDRAAVENPEAFLVRMVTRLCLDVLKSVRMRREEYPGPWLPEPLVDPTEDDSDNITLTLMMALERLSPLERAAFLLHDVFGSDFNEVAQAIGRDSAACRQLASRARTHVHNARPRYPIPEQQGRDIAAAFFKASRGGDLQALQMLLAADVVTYTDGGGKRPAALKPLFGQDRVARFFIALTRKEGFRPGQLLSICRIDGLPGFLTLEQDGILQATALELDADRIAAIYIVRNPDKLAHLHGPA